MFNAKINNTYVVQSHPSNNYILALNMVKEIYKQFKKVDKALINPLMLKPILHNVKSVGSSRERKMKVLFSKERRIYKFDVRNLHYAWAMHIQVALES